MGVGHQGLFFIRFDGDPDDPPHAVGARGLYYNRNRWYSPDLGRFIQRDVNETALPIITALAFNAEMLANFVSAFNGQALYAGGMNLYEYAGSNPIRFGDPLGLDWFDDIDDCIAGIWAGRAERAQGLYDAFGSLFQAAGEAALQAVIEGMVISLVPGGIFIVGAYHAVNGAIDIHDNGLGWGNALGVVGGGALMGGALGKAFSKFRGHRASLRAQGGCFVAGTLVLLGNGTFVPIESLQAGDRVMVAGGECQEVETASVLATHEFVAEELLVLDLGDMVEPLTVTAEHPTWISDQGWTPARQIEAGDCLVNMDVVPLEVLNVTVQETPEPVYNLTVGGTNTYFVTSAGLLVHNKPTQYRGFGDFAYDIYTSAGAAIRATGGGRIRVRSGPHCTDAGWAEAGFTEAWYFRCNDGKKYTVLHDPIAGDWTFPHLSHSQKTPPF